MEWMIPTYQHPKNENCRCIGMRCIDVKQYILSALDSGN